MILLGNGQRVKHRTVVCASSVERCRVDGAPGVLVRPPGGAVAYSPRSRRAVVGGRGQVDWAFGPSAAPLALDVRDTASLCFTADLPRLEVALHGAASLVVRGRVPCVVVRHIDPAASLDLSALSECRLLAPLSGGSIRRPAPPVVDGPPRDPLPCALCCADDAPAASLMPCGHSDICLECAVQWGQRSATCPFCRAPLVSLFRHPLP